jgi:hypothetical protein
MLWFKAWAESRARFAIAAALIVAVCGYVIAGAAPTRALFGGLHRLLFIVFALIFGMGGLVREHQVGTAPFTLSLPVSRSRLTLVRAITGLSELAVIGFLPVVIIAACALFGRQPYPLADALGHALRWLAGGSALFALAFLASVILPGEYNSFVAAFVTYFGHTVTTQFVRIAKPATRPYLYTVHDIMSELKLSLAVPTAATIGLAVCFIALATIWTNRKDF